jgi:hypothetical protein
MNRQLQCDRGSASRLLGLIVPVLLTGAMETLPARGWASDAALDQEPISYSSPETDNPVARLQARIDRREVVLKHDDSQGYLRAVLENLEIPASSQGLVYSRTSFQRDRISPTTPRAIYFGDDSYVGWVQHGEVLEISTIDPQKGAIFYVLSQKAAERPVFRRQTHECLQCHESGMSQGVPGHFVRSVYPDARGQPILSAGTFVTGHQSPLRERWGGWYVTGTHGDQRHMGNLLVRERSNTFRPEEVDLEAGANVESLESRCDVDPYLSPHSDIVALMVLEHQTQMHNLLTRANHLTRIALRDELSLNRALGRRENERLDSTTSRIRSAGEPLVKYLLFADEAGLTAPIRGTSSFTEDFSRRGPKDTAGRSLREFDLNKRMFRYPLSYLIYSETFDGEPAELKEYVYRRLWEILAGKDTTGKFTHLTEADRQAIREILVATKPGLPAYWTIKN